MKTKKMLTLATIVTGLTVGTLLTRVPQDLVRLHHYTNQTEKALAQHEWLTDSIRNSYTHSSTAYEIAEGEFTIKVSADITSKRIMYWNTKKVLTIYRNKTLSKILEIYGNIRLKKQHRQKRELKEEKERKPTYNAKNFSVPKTYKPLCSRTRV